MPSVESIPAHPEDPVQGQKDLGPFGDRQCSSDSGQNSRADHKRCHRWSQGPWLWFLWQHHRFSRRSQSVSESHLWGRRWGWGYWSWWWFPSSWWGLQEWHQQPKQWRSGQHELVWKPQDQHQWNAQRWQPSKGAGAREEGSEREQDGWDGGRGGGRGSRRRGTKKRGYEGVVQCGVQQHLGTREVQCSQVSRFTTFTNPHKHRASN